MSFALFIIVNPNTSPQVILNPPVLRSLSEVGNIVSGEGAKEILDSSQVRLGFGQVRLGQNDTQNTTKEVSRCCLGTRSAQGGEYCHVE